MYFSRIGPVHLAGDDLLSPLFKEFSSSAPAAGTPLLQISFSEEVFRYRYDEKAKICLIPARHRDNPATINEMVKKCVVPFLLHEYRGFLFHAALLVGSETSFLLTGVSGSGKSTLVQKLASFFQCGNDDLSLIQPSTQGFSAHSTPFCDWKKVSSTGAFPFPLAADPIHRVVILKKETSTSSFLIPSLDKDRVWRFLIEQQQIFFPHWHVKTTHVLSKQIHTFIEETSFACLHHNLNDPPEKVYELLCTAQ